MTFFIVAIIVWLIMVVISAIHSPHGLEMDEHLFLILLAAFWPITLMVLVSYIFASALTWCVHRLTGRY